MILGIDGGATATKAVVWNPTQDKIMFQCKGSPSNAILLSENELKNVMLQIHDEVARFLKKDWTKINSISLCLAGVVNKQVHEKVWRCALEIWPDSNIFVSHDLTSALFSGTNDGQGIAVISGTGASVYGRHKNKELRAGGWGHILGDSGSGYHIAHMGLRSITANYDQQGNPNALAKLFLKATESKNLEELAAYVSVGAKPQVAELSKLVFKMAAKNDRHAKKIVHLAAASLASNVAAVSKRLKTGKVPIVLSGGVFEGQKDYIKLFSQELKKLLPWAKPQLAKWPGALGAARWGHIENQNTKVAEKKTHLNRVQASLSKIDLSSLTTEDKNPRSSAFSKLSARDAVCLMIEEDKILPSVLAKVENEIAATIESIAKAFKNGGRLIYLGAGTSGRLGVLDASECPPTFCSPPEQVQAIIAGGERALRQAVEGAEDDTKAAELATKSLRLNKNDVVVGIAASGRTPFVLAGLEVAKAHSATCVLLSCNPKTLEKYGKRFDHEIHLETGPEVLTGSTRLRAGTATKMVLNMLSTISMAQIGKVQGNYMVDLNPTNDKLRARALRIFMELKNSSEEKALEALNHHHWRLRLALE